MKSKISIVTDSTADIPENDQDTYHIEVVPAILTLDGQTYLDGRDISRNEFYRRLPNLQKPATTAAPSIKFFEDTYERLLSSGIERILSIHLPTTLSSMLDVATQAAKSFAGRVKVFDSGQVSLGMGFQAIEAASAALKDASFEAVLEIVQRTKNNIRLIAVIDTLEFLKRSGRIGWLSAGLGNLLQIKVVLELFNGVVSRLAQVRTRGKALAQLEQIAESWGVLDRMAIAHSAISEEAEKFADKIRHLCRTQPLVIDVTTAIGAHIGPRALGIIGLRQMG
jgi:DegV family protein with EDD domain